MIINEWNSTADEELTQSLKLLITFRYEVISHLIYSNIECRRQNPSIDEQSIYICYFFLLLLRLQIAVITAPIPKHKKIANQTAALLLSPVLGASVFSLFVFVLSGFFTGAVGFGVSVGSIVFSPSPKGSGFPSTKTKWFYFWNQ